jgi:regulator of sigma E protease
MDYLVVAFWLAGTIVCVLSPIILIHELGHFLVGKLAGVRIEEFGLGFPPRVLTVGRGRGLLQVGDTSVVIPRGYRLPPGIDVGVRVAAEVLRRPRGDLILRGIRPVDHHAVPTQTTTPSALPQPSVLEGVVILVDPGTEYTLNLLPVGGFVRMTGEEDPSDPVSLASKSKRWRLATLAAGPLLNMIVAVALAAGAYWSGLPDSWLIRITAVQPSSSADTAGLSPGDVIVSIGGQRITDGMLQVSEVVREHPGEQIDLAVLRQERLTGLTATLGRDSEGNGLLGIAMVPHPDKTSIRGYSFAEGVAQGLRDTGNVVLMTVQVPLRLLSGEMSAEEARPSSVVGISGVLTLSLQQSFEWGLAFPALQTASIISLMLGLTNLLPLPALDGGRILFVVLEAVRGRRVSPQREAAFHLVGMLILLALLGLMAVQDVLNPIIPWSLLK